MLEVKNLTFQVQENGVERSIVENISFDVAGWRDACHYRTKWWRKVHTCESFNGN